MNCLTVYDNYDIAMLHELYKNRSIENAHEATLRFRDHNNLGIAQEPR
jgi:hypothetical protein